MRRRIKSPHKKSKIQKADIKKAVLSAKEKRRFKMKLTLTNDEGVILGKYSIGNKREFDVGDLGATPEHDMYLEDRKDLCMDDLRDDILKCAELEGIL